jgi:hypothetical protein
MTQMMRAIQRDATMQRANAKRVSLSPALTSAQTYDGSASDGFDGQAKLAKMSRSVETADIEGNNTVIIRSAYELPALEARARAAEFGKDVALLYSQFRSPKRVVVRRPKLDRTTGARSPACPTSSQQPPRVPPLRVGDSGLCSSANRSLRTSAGCKGQGS